MKRPTYAEQVRQVEFQIRFWETVRLSDLRREQSGGVRENEAADARPLPDLRDWGTA